MPHPHHHSRFYILMATVVVGAILILMLMNEGGTFPFMTGSSVGTGVDDHGSEVMEEIMEEEVRTSGKIGIEFLLGFDSAPEVSEETKVETIELTFEDLNNKIRINEEELEVKGLERVEMKIEGFEGEVTFDELDISLSGVGEKVTVNGIEISTQKEMKVSFNGLIYETLKIEEIDLERVNFEKGYGTMSIGGKMDYELENEDVKVGRFRGDLSVGVDEGSLVVMEGEIEGVKVEGDFNLVFS